MGINRLCVQLEAQPLVDIAYKLARLRRWSRTLGPRQAIAFEWQQSLNQPVTAFRHPVLDRPIYLRAHTSDVSVFEDVFLNHEFAIDLDPAPKVIIDAGANCGLVTLYLAWRYPEARIIAIEPSPDNVAMMRRNLAGVRGVEIVQGALWSSSTWLRIANPEAPGWSYRCEETTEDTHGAFRSVDLATLLAERALPRCDLLKLDIEGAEIELFTDPGAWLDITRGILVELHGDDARALVHRQCPSPPWTVRHAGEKLLFTRDRPRPGDAPSRAPALDDPVAPDPLAPDPGGAAR